MSFKTGDLVHIKFSTLEGEVTGAAVDDQANFLLKVLYTDKNGEVQERFFVQEDLEAV
jgi:hypothetical protein